MSLLTPPSTSHRHREMQGRKTKTGSRVVWAGQNQFFTLTTSPLKGRVGCSASRKAGRSILKPIVAPLPQLLPETPQREETPEPAHPLSDEMFLERPLAIILSTEVALRDLVDAYTTLTARLRFALLDDPAAADADIPLLRPLRRQSSQVTQALCRDIQRALEDPAASRISTRDADLFACPTSSLPSPKASPTKKRHGLTEDEVKHARDLFSVSNAALRLLLIAFTVPTLYRCFSEDDLSTILTEVLAIPLSSDLPTPNARKTHSTAIWVLQVQRLPASILKPAADRIAYAIQRGIDGELGKEGKKGSIADGLKAIHDLSLYQPLTFVPAFTKLLPSILGNLLAPTVSLRVLAAQAIGGYAYALGTTAGGTDLHAQAADCVVDFLVPVVDAPSGSSPPPSPSKDPAIVKTLRTTMGQTEPAHTAHGPQWACCVLAAFIVLLGSRVYTDEKVQRTLRALLTVTMKHKKSSVRALGTLVWRCFGWVYFQTPLPAPEELAGEEDEDAEGEPEVDEERALAIAAYDDLVHTSREKFFTSIQTIAEMGTCTVLIAGLLGEVKTVTDDMDSFERAASILDGMLRRGGNIYDQAADVMQQLLSPFSLAPETLEDMQEARTNAGEWAHHKLLSIGMFSANPGLLSVDSQSLPTAVRPILNEAPSVDDVRWLTPEELATNWVFDILLKVWISLVRGFKWPKDNNADILFRTWRALFAPAIDHIQESEMELRDEEIARMADSGVAVLLDLVQDPMLGFNTETAEPGQQIWHTLAIKFHIVDALLATLKDVIPRPQLARHADNLRAALFSNSSGIEEDISALSYWAQSCANALVLGEAEDLQSFCEESCVTEMNVVGRTIVWRVFAETWMLNDSPLDSIVLLLGLYFGCANDTPNELWDSLFQHAVALAAAVGRDRANLLDDIAAAIPRGVFTPLVADALLNKLELDELREVPTHLFEQVDAAMRAAYEASESDYIPAIWVIRSITQMVGTCPTELFVDMLVTMQDGLFCWLADENGRLGEDDYNAEIIPLFKAVLLELHTVPDAKLGLEKASNVLEGAFHGAHHDTIACVQALQEFCDVAFGGEDDGLTSGLRECLRSGSNSRESLLIEEGSPPPWSQDDEEVESILPPSRPFTPELELPVAVTAISPPAVEDVTDDEEPLSFPDSEDEESNTLPPSSPIVMRPTTPMHYPTTPQRTRPRPSSPATSIFSTEATLPALSSPSRSDAPSSPTTPRRGYSSPLRSTKNKSIRVFDKENSSPGAIRTVMQRLAAQSVTPSKLGKRLTSDRDGYDDEAFSNEVGPPAKRLRFDTSPIRVNMLHTVSPNFQALDNEKDDEPIPKLVLPRAVPQLTGSFYGTPSLRSVGNETPKSKSCPGPVSSSKTSKVGRTPVKRLDDDRESDAESDTTPTKSKPMMKPQMAMKRKRCVFDCVEIPLTRRLEEFDHPKSQPTPTKASVTSRRSFRKSKSDAVLTKAFTTEFVTPKKARTINRSSSATLVGGLSQSVDGEDEDTAPLPSLFDTPMVPFGSDDSIMQADDEDVEIEAALPSSDDGLALGHVTPRAVLSPAPRRFLLEDQEEYDQEPGSDDSVPSPSRGPARRRALRASAV